MSKKKNKPKFRCKSEAQKKAIRKSYAEKSAKEKRRIEAAYPHFRYYKKSKHPALIVGELCHDDAFNGFESFFLIFIAAINFLGGNIDVGI